MGKTEHYVIVVDDVFKARKVLKMLNSEVRAIAILVLASNDSSFTGKLGSIVKNYGATVFKGYLPLPSS